MPRVRHDGDMTNAERVYLTTAEVAARYRTAASTVRYWRHRGTGPRGIPIGRRTLYDLAELERWERERTGAEAVRSDDAA
jgi:hypothetical protein